MGNLNETGLTLDDMERAPVQDKLNETFDDKFLHDVSSFVPDNNGQFNARVMSIILTNLSKGCSLYTAVRAAGQVPAVVYKWLKHGMEQYKRLSEDELDRAETDPESLPPECRFYLQVMQTQAEFTVEMQSILYDHRNEASHEWIAQWLLGVTEPDRYNLKYRMHKEDMNAENNNGSLNVHYVIEDPHGVRTSAEMEEIRAAMADMKNKYREQAVDKDADDGDADPKE